MSLLVSYVIGTDSPVGFRRLLQTGGIYNGQHLSCARIHNLYHKIKTAYDNGTIDKVRFDACTDESRTSDMEVHAFLQHIADSKHAFAQTSSVLDFLLASVPGFQYRLLKRMNPSTQQDAIGGVVWMFPNEKMLLNDFGDVLFIDATTNISKEQYYYFPISAVNEHGKRLTVARALLFSDKSDEFLMF
jgi:hypothetical protein